MADKIDFIEAMSVLTMEPGDTLVLKADRQLTGEMVSWIRGHIAETLPGVPVLVLDGGFDIGVLRQA
jgi:hypothetical protein